MSTAHVNFQVWLSISLLKTSSFLTTEFGAFTVVKEMRSGMYMCLKLELQHMPHVYKTHTWYIYTTPINDFP